MVRVPCCDKETVRKGAWSAEEDNLLKSYVEKNGAVTNWIALPTKIPGLNRCGKSCRLRWQNYLRPNIKHGDFTEEEDRIISNIYYTVGSRWSLMAEKLEGRTDNDIKNYWHTKLQKKLLIKQNKTKRRSNHRALSEIHEDYNHTESNPNCTSFTITNGHLMSSNWTHPTSHTHPPPTTTTIVCLPLNTISFTTTCVNCNQQQQHQQHQHGLVNLDGVGSSSSMQYNNMNNDYNDGNVKLDSIIREMEAALLSNDSPSRATEGPDLLSSNHGEKEIVGNNNMKDVMSNEASCGESIGSWDWGDIPFPMDELDDHNIDWEGILLNLSGDDDLDGH